MDQYSILDCTLRDGGYITNWYFGRDSIRNIIGGLSRAGIDYIECGYLNPSAAEPDRAIFSDIDGIESFLPEANKSSFFLAMADCAQILPSQITPHTGRSIDGIRVVFYKHQIDQALELCKSVQDNGYKLFVQPMVTIDYSFQEYGSLIEKIGKLRPDLVSIVDSFGYMDKKDFRNYFSLLDESLEQNVSIGIHSHNNMQLSFIVAQDVLDYETKRTVVIDASLSGMGRGAGNLNTELIVNYYNRLFHSKYDIGQIMSLISREIMPIARTHTWGYSPYLFLTGLYHCHPNFACYLLETHDVSVEEFEAFVRFIPQEMLTKCRRPYVEELYQKFIISKEKNVNVE